MESKRRPCLVLACAVSLLVLGSATAQEADDAIEGPEFGGTYADLNLRQRELFDDLCRRLTELTAIQLDPAEMYDRARLSARTTYQAVTHALSTTSLTNENGESLGTALDLIGHLETVEGKRQEARSDQQFRMYVRLEPDAVEILERSQEFSRGMDNSVYHHGYPINYRQRGGVPTIQFSVTGDHQRADIDVDYRSAKFPFVLFNGHLTASNSDVRAGNNAERHNQRWRGFADWWRGLFGLARSGDTYVEEQLGDYEIPVAPRAGEEEIHVAVHDFLNAWLVEGEPTLAAAYISERAFECLALDEDGEEPFDYGLAQFEILWNLNAVNDELGRVERLEDVVTGVRFARPGATVVRQDHHAQFVLYAVQDDLAASLECANRKRLGKPPEPQAVPSDASIADFNYFAATFFLELPRGSGGALGLLWAREGGHWKIVSYEVEMLGASDERTMPDIRPGVETGTLERVAGDPALLAATEGFLEAWLVEKDLDSTLGYLSPDSLPCVNLELEPGETAYPTPEGQRSRVRFGLERATERLGPVAELEGVIGGVELWLPEVRIVTHDREDAYTLFSLPDWRGNDARCQRQLEEAEPTPLEERLARYGRYYVSALRIETFAGETAALLLGWTMEDGVWRIYTYRVLEP